MPVYMRQPTMPALYREAAGTAPRTATPGESPSAPSDTTGTLKREAGITQPALHIGTTTVQGWGLGLWVYVYTFDPTRKCFLPRKQRTARPLQDRAHFAQGCVRSFKSAQRSHFSGGGRKAEVAIVQVSARIFPERGRKG